jgi:hypothetical protein
MPSACLVARDYGWNCLPIRNAQPLASVDPVHVEDSVGRGDGPRTYPIVAANAIQCLAILDGVIIGTAWMRTGARRRVRRWMWRWMWIRMQTGWDPQRLTGPDVVAVAEPVFAADSVSIYAVHAADGE